MNDPQDIVRQLRIIGNTIGRYSQSTLVFDDLASLIEVIWNWHRTEYCECDGSIIDERCYVADRLVRNVANQLSL